MSEILNLKTVARKKYFSITTKIQVAAVDQDILYSALSHLTLFLGYFELFGLLIK